jgi:thioesterase domain-containing protein/acyl carrier protein
MTRATPREIAGDIEVYLRCSSHIPENDPRFTRDVNLWEEAYVDSTGVVELIVHLESRWEVDLPDEVVFDPDFSSVNGIARLVHSLRARQNGSVSASTATRPGNPAHDASLVLMQPQGEGTPLFLVHAGDGQALPYANLARRLAGTRPVYALQLLTEGGLPMVHTRIEEMAVHYVAAVRGARPHGPYLLGGSCLGALVASEMARHLEAEHEEVRLVLLDAADPSASRRPNLEMRRRADRARNLVRTTALHRLPVELARKLSGFARFEWQRLRKRTSAWVGLHAIRLCRDLRLPPPRWVRELPVRALCMLAIERYRAGHMLRASIVLFCGTVGLGEDEPLAQVYADPKLGWQARSEQPLRRIDVAGGHVSMLQEPHVAELAQALREVLDDARGHIATAPVAPVAPVAPALDVERRSAV